MSLLNVLQIFASQFIRTLEGLLALELEFSKSGSRYDAKTVGTVLGELRHDCERLELVSAGKQVSYILKIFDERLTTPERHGGIIPYQELREMVSQLRRRVHEDLEETVFFQLGPSLVRKLFKRVETEENSIEILAKEPAEILGAQVVDNFPSIVFDFTEACRCLAVSRSTACVFHLMRVLELGLTVLGIPFGVELSHTNWAPAIDELTKRVGGMGNDPKWNVLSGWRDQKEFFSQAISHLSVTKDAWRTTLHMRAASSPRKRPV